ncbi:hypothetical protein RRF57_011141 [Xylaria bambusicola]|uniref:Uncharacterized protein n=1 Tax=Xylaria bambusicola TaxID=326684 RepID=A0AAN7V2B8_9PEZI
MQVNWESREQVLAGRHVQITVGGRDDLVKVTYENHVSSCSYFGVSSPNALYGFFFVKWDIDVSLWQNNLQASMNDIFKSSCLQKMQRIVLNFNVPLYPYNRLYDRNDKESFFSTAVTLVAISPLPVLSSPHPQREEQGSPLRYICDNSPLLVGISFIIEYEDSEFLSEAWNIGQ